MSKIIDFPTATGGTEKKPASTLPQDGRNEDALDDPENYTAPAWEDTGAAVERLAKLSPLEFDRVCKLEASNLGVTVATLTSEVKKARKTGGALTQEMQGHWKVDPWAVEVNGRELIGEISKRIHRHLVMSEHGVRAVALWIVFTWMHKAAVYSPIMLVSSPEAECGKSTLLGLISYLVPKGLTIVEISPAVLYRMIEKWHPTLIVDEADVAFKNNPELRAVINAGWTRGTGVPRCHPETHDPEFFETFGPKAIGLKGLNVPGTTLSRSIVIEMERKLPDDKAVDFAHADDEGLADLRSKLKRFAEDNIGKLPIPVMPEGFNNRLAANWRLMLSIAQLCGRGGQARSCAVALSKRSDEASLGVELLRDIRDTFVKRRIDRIRSEELVNKLVGIEDRQWREMPFTGKPITQTILAKQLKPYGVRPTTIKFEGDIAFKGYRLDQFEKAFRYIPADPDREAPRHTPQDSRNPVTTAGNSQKCRNPEDGQVTAKMAENSQSYRVTPVQGGMAGSPSAAPEKKVCTACDGHGCPTCKPREHGIGR